MQIVSLRIKNFLGISDVELKPGQVNQIVGANNQGKTSVIKALEFAIRGANDGSLVKFGEDAAEVIVELDDQTTIRRRLSAQGKGSLSVKKDGFDAQKPQAFLDGLFDGTAFNPLEVLDPKRRTEAILSSLDVKVDRKTLADMIEWPEEHLPPIEPNQHGLKVLDQAHAFFYQRRHEANRVAAEKKKRWETYRDDLPMDLKPSAYTRDQLTARKAAEEKTLERIRTDQNALTAKAEERTKALERVRKYQEAVNGFDVKIRWHEEELKTLRTRRDEGLKFVDQATAEVPPEVDGSKLELECAQVHTALQEIGKQFLEVERYEQNRKEHGRVGELEQEYQEAQRFAENLDEVVKQLSGPAQEELMESAEMPIKGLEYREGQFLVEGVPVDNLSSSAAMRLAVGVARKLARKTKLICIDGAEALDQGSYNALRSEIDGDGYTYFLTKVGNPFVEPRDQVVSMQGGAVRA